MIQRRKGRERLDFFFVFFFSLVCFEQETKSNMEEEMIQPTRPDLLGCKSNWKRVWFMVYAYTP